MVTFLVDRFYILIWLAGMPGFCTRRSVAPLRRISFHFYTLLGSLFFHRFIVDDWLHKILYWNFNDLIRSIVTRLQQVFIEVKIGIGFSAS